MRPGEPLFDAFSTQVDALTPRLFADEEMRQLTISLLDYARETCGTIGMPRLMHYRTALQRVMNTEGVNVPDGRVFKTSSYENFQLGKPATEDEDFSLPPIEYENLLLLQTNDKDDDKGRVANFLDKLFDEQPKHKGTFAVFGLVTPKDVPNVTSVDAITFAVVQTNTGESYGFSFRENPHKGKLRSMQGVSSEDGTIRELHGAIDTCPVEAVPLSRETITAVRLELEKAREMFVDGKGQKKIRTSNARLEKAQDIGRGILTRVGLFGRVESKESLK